MIATLIMLVTLFFVPKGAFGATIYIDRALGTNCTSGNYSIASRNCTGSDGNAYNNVQSAISSSANNDTINIRAGSYTSNASTTNGIVVKTGQTWQTYSGDLPSKATITAGATHDFVFLINGISNATVRNLIAQNSRREAIRVWGSGNSIVTDNEVSGWNQINEEYWAGIGYRGAGASGLIARNYVHSPAFNTNGVNGAITVGVSVSNITIEDNWVENASMGIWLDVDAGNPNIGLTPIVITRNVAKNISRHCYHMEARSVAVMRYNLGIACQETGLLIRPGPTSTTNGLKVQHNSFYNLGLTGIWVQRDQSTSQVINSNFDNNILHGNSSSASAGSLLTVGTGITSEASNTFRNNLFFHSGTNTKAVCWNDGQGTSHSCDGSPTQYSTSQIGNFNSNVSMASGNIGGDPHFANPSAADLRLCEGSSIPVSSCKGKSPAIDGAISLSLPFNGVAPDIGAMESGSSNVASPLLNSPLSIPGVLQAETFDTGGQNVGYYDTTSANLSGAYRTSEAVDIKAAPDGVGYTIGYTEAGEWLKFTVNVTQTGNYAVTVRGANGSASNGALRIEVDGLNSTGTITIAPTGSYKTEATVVGPVVSLAQGTRTFRVFIETGNFDFNWFEFALSSSKPTQIPDAPANITVVAQ